MPPLTRWFVKTSFVYFTLALLVGVFLGAQAVWKFNVPVAEISPVYFHLLAEGWISMLIIGVVFWMFPKYTLERPRRSEALAWASYIMLNVGLVLRIISEPLIGLGESPISIWTILLILAALVQWAGGMAFVINSWGRVKVK
jgi:hypothetical protein